MSGLHGPFSYLLKFSWTRFSFMYPSSCSRWRISGSTAWNRAEDGHPTHTSTLSLEECWLTSSVDLEAGLCLVDMLLTWLSTSVFNWNDSVRGLIMKIAPSELQVFTDCWCHTFFPSVSKAERISRQRKLWACTSCKGRVLLNWLSPITFWVWSRSTTHFSSVGSLEITDRRYSKSFTTTHNCRK